MALSIRIFFLASFASILPPLAASRARRISPLSFWRGCGSTLSSLAILCLSYALSLAVVSSARDPPAPEGNSKSIHQPFRPAPQVVSPAAAGLGGPPAALSGRKKASGRHTRMQSSNNKSFYLGRSTEGQTGGSGIIKFKPNPRDRLDSHEDERSQMIGEKFSYQLEVHDQ